MEGWSLDLGIWEALGLVAWLLRAPALCFLCEVGWRAVPLCGRQQGGPRCGRARHGCDPKGPEAPNGDRKWRPFLPADKQGGSRPAHSVSAVAARFRWLCSRGNRSAGVGTSSEVPPPAGSLGSEAGIHRLPFPSLGLSPWWTTASHPHPGQLSVQRRKLRQQPSSRLGEGEGLASSLPGSWARGRGSHL